MKRKYFSKLFPWTVYMVMVVTVCLITSAASCTFSPDGFTMISGDYTSPTLEHFTMSDEMSATINFSHEVSFPRLEYYKLPQNAPSSAATQAELVGNVFAEQVTDSSQSDDTATRYTLNFPNNTDPGMQYILSGTVKDATGSTLTFDIGFTGYNSRVPHIVFSEINTEHSKPRTEFVEFYVLEDGNLGGMILQSGGDGIEKDYIFPAIEVNAGEYLVLHMRSIEEGLVNETGDDLSLSAGKHASAEGRDLWIPGAETRLSTIDVLVLRKRLNGPLIDAVLYARSERKAWTKDLMSTYAREAYDAQIWVDGSEITAAASTDNSTATRTLSRQNIANIAASFEPGATPIANRADDWIIVASSNTSPGKANSSKPYVPK